MEIKKDIINQNKKINLQRLAQDKKARSLASLSMTIFAISFFAVVAIRPTLVTIAKLTKEINDKREANNELQNKIKTLIAAQDEYVKNSDNIYLLDQALPKRSEFPLLASMLEQTAADSQVELKSFNFEKVFITQNIAAKDSEPPYSKLGFSLSAASDDYLKLKDFVSKLETNKRIIKINETSFNPMKKKDTQSSTPESIEKLTTEIIISVAGEVFFEKDQSK